MADLASLTSTISIVLGVLTYFLTMMLDKARTLLREDVPAPAQKNAREGLRNRLLVVLISAALPLFLAFSVLFYLCLPTIFAIRDSSSFQFWNFDLTKTLFVFLDLSIGGCLAITIIFGLLLLRKLRLCMTA